MSKVSFSTYLTMVDTETECVEFDVTVRATVTAGRPQCNYLANGDPGYPAEDAEIDSLQVFRRVDGKELEVEWDSIPKREQERLEEKVFEGGADDDFPEPDDVVLPDDDRHCPQCEYAESRY